MQQKTEINIILVITIVLIALSVALIGMQFMIFKDVTVLKDTLHYDISTPIIDETVMDDEATEDETVVDEGEETSCVDEELDVAWVLKDFEATTVKPIGWTVDQVDLGGASIWQFVDNVNESNKVRISIYQPWLMENIRFSYASWLEDHNYSVVLSSGNTIGGLAFDYYSTPNDPEYENAFVMLYSEDPNYILEIKRSATIMPPEAMKQIIDSLDFDPTEADVENAYKDSCPSNY